MRQKLPNRTAKVAYHSHRPFLIVNVSQRPAKDSRTSRKGWGDEPAAWEVSEHPVMVDRVTTRHLRSASAILDILAGAVVKNRFADAKDADVFAHYSKKYADKINEAIDIWQRRAGQAAHARALAEHPLQAARMPAKLTPLHGGVTVTI